MSLDLLVSQPLATTTAVAVAYFGASVLLWWRENVRTASVQAMRLGKVRFRHSA
jgi:hypothetical protein